MRCQVILCTALHDLDWQGLLLSITHDTAIVQLHLAWILSLDLLLGILVRIFFDEGPCITKPLIRRLTTYIEVLGRKCLVVLFRSHLLLLNLGSW